jgi:hypothetical protein
MRVINPSDPVEEFAQALKVEFGKVLRGASGDESWRKAARGIIEKMGLEVLTNEETLSVLCRASYEARHAAPSSALQHGELMQKFFAGAGYIIVKRDSTA